jgi:REP element-mobilizing transposase RayT
MSRGNAKQTIFIDTADYERFLDLLATAATRFGVVCRAYCLMPNHFHLLAEPDSWPLSRMMQQLNSAYSQSFNRRHHRVGHVLQGRFKALLVDRDEYFLQLLRYIVLNPVEAGLVNDPEAWQWSSYRATAGLGAAPALLALDDVWRMFDIDDDNAKRRFVAFVDAGRGLPAPSEPLVFGSDPFKADIAVALEPHRDSPDFSRDERHAVRPTLESLLDGNEGPPRIRSVAEAFLRYGYTLREIGTVLGCHPSTVWKQIRRAHSARNSKSGPSAPTSVFQDDAGAKIKI